MRTIARRKEPTLKRFLDWPTTVLFLLAFGSLLVLFDIVQRAARLFGQRPQEYAAAALQWSIWRALHLSGTRFEVERSPLVRPHTPYILVSNHQSMFDIAAVGGLFFTNLVKYVAKRELTHGIPGISYNLRAGGHALIDRGNRGQAVREIRALGERAARRGCAVLIYPEGTRARDGALKEFKPAGTLELLDAAPALEVVPIALDESWRIVRHGLRPVPFGTRVRIRIGDPIPRAAGEDRAALLRGIEAWIRATVEGWRAF